MDADQRFAAFIDQWAAKQGCRFITQACDGRESPDLIDGMAVDDVWGWLLRPGEAEATDDNFGCIEWSVENGRLKPEWNTYD